MSAIRALNMRKTASALKAPVAFKRTLATPVNSLYTPVLPAKIPAALHLKSGQSYFGSSFGSENSKFGETVFSTSITSCKYIAFMAKRMLQMLTMIIRHRLYD